MTEPVAYVQIRDGKAYSVLRKGTPNDEYTPVYTADQLHPRVKMTQNQYDRLMWDKSHTNLSTCLEYFLNSDGNNHFGLSSENLKGNLTQEDIARAWLNPEETIEIVPDMKWFVRRMLPNTGSNMLYCNDDGELTYNCNKEAATQFDTKEEAEKWTNPLTEAVQLPVEDK